MSSPRPNIVVLDEGQLLNGGLHWDAVRALGNLMTYPHTPVSEILSRAEEAQILLTNKTPLNAATLRGLPNLRFISVLATGFNVVDTVAARLHGIPVSNVPSYSTDSVAQHTFALILELTNHAAQHARAVSGGHWAQSGAWSAPLTSIIELRGCCLGLIGRGRIARRVAEIAFAFGMDVIMASTSYPNGTEEFVSLHEIAKTADIISLHCQLTETNRCLINADFLVRMKPSAFLINTARGALINELDLATALARGVIAGAALDVLSTEPPAAHHPLFHAPNCLITPHMAWTGRAARQRLLATTAENIAAFLASTPIHVVNG